MGSRCSTSKPPRLDNKKSGIQVNLDFWCPLLGSPLNIILCLCLQEYMATFKIPAMTENVDGETPFRESGRRKWCKLCRHHVQSEQGNGSFVNDVTIFSGPLLSRSSALYHKITKRNVSPSISLTSFMLTLLFFSFQWFLFSNYQTYKTFIKNKR